MRLLPSDMHGNFLCGVFAFTDGLFCVIIEKKGGVSVKNTVIGILAHVDSGKTTLSEALLYCSGAIGRLGRVDHRDSFLDTYALERDRGITIFSKQALLCRGDCTYYLLDTPGHVDFSAETERTLQVLDYAILVISGTDGVQSHTDTLWRLLRKYRVPCFLFVNKMDLAGAERAFLLNELRGKLGDCCVDFSDTVSDAFFENVALCDETLLTKYEESALSDADITDAIAARKLFPCFFGSALKLDGVQPFLSALDRYTKMPAFADRFGAKVYKLAEDAQGNRLTFLKVTGGTLRVREVLESPKNTAGEKVNQIRVYSGEKYKSVNEACAGMVCAVTGITFARPGDGLGAEQNGAMPVLEPVLTYRLELPDTVSVHTALAHMRVLEAEDPQLNVFRDERSGDIGVQLMGEIQLEVLRSLIKERFGYDVGFGRGNIIYKETIESTVEGVGHFEPLRHYAEVHLLLKPGKRDSGLLFTADCREDLLDRNWQRLILTHLYEKTHLGVLTGSPITDMEITLAAGRAHPKHTEGGDFRQATYRAVRQGLRTAKSVLLEPVYRFVLEVPIENLGRAMNDIQRMSGSFEPPVQEGESCVLTGCAPVAQIRDYAKELMQYTRGRGKLSLTLKGYEPCHNAEEVIASFGYDPDADVLNPCDSVFCSHGAGHIVKWDDVKNHMHVASVLKAASPAPSLGGREYLEKRRKQVDLFASDKELMRIFEQTYGAVKPRSRPSEKRVFKAPEKAAQKRKAPVQYDGDDYLLVDGYNVIFAWEHLKSLTFEGAREALINILCNYQGFKKCEVIVVFDAYKVKGQQREVERVNNISVVYTKEAETADMYIEKVSHQLAKRHRVRVVTSDALEQLIILGNGALRVSSRAFLEEVRQAEEEIRRLIAEEYADN